ncbi:MAG: RNA polymerase factor sigma-54 [Bryobacteraceae bacterium]
MSLLSPRLQLKVAQKQILTPGLVQMVTVLQLNRLELKDMITQEIAENPVLEEGLDGAEELTPEELQTILEAERDPHPADEGILATVEAANAPEAAEEIPVEIFAAAGPAGSVEAEQAATAENVETLEQAPSTDPFDEIDFGSFFDDYLDPGYKSPAGESHDKPSFETFLSSPVTLSDYLQQQLSLVALTDSIRDAADAVIGNLDEKGYLMSTIEELVEETGQSPETIDEALRFVQSLDPAGVAARDLRECMLLQLESMGARDGVAWKIVCEHLKLVELRQFKELAKVLGRPAEHIQAAVEVIRHLDPHPGLRYSGEGAQKIEPDVSITKDGDEYVIELNDDDLPQLRLNPEYRRMLNRGQEPSKEVRNYVKERFTSALLLIKNIEQRKHTILKVCKSIVERQREFLALGIEHLRPMMIKDVAEEIGVHASTVSRAVANKYAHTPQGVFELRYFFSEAVQGPSGGGTPLLLLKRRVKKMIESEDAAHPLTDEHITARLQSEGIHVTRRTVAKYREDMKIPSTHQRRQRE